jgi:peptidoglycan/LPS O-acetylase OafA/YrhL
MSVARPRRESSLHVENREPVLDGIRGLAILLVLWHHTVIFSGFRPAGPIDQQVWQTAFSSWLGVDLFFVLSGYLITGILHDAKSSPRYFLNFYGRRVLRILPLYYTVLLLAFVVLPRLGWQPAPDGTMTNPAWYWLHAINVKIALDGWPTPIYLGHFWSLAIEEQFYLIWPLIVFALDRRPLILMTVLMLAAAYWLRRTLPLHAPDLAVYVLMPTRMDALAAGALVALLLRSPRCVRHLRLWSMVVGALCGAVILLMFHRMHGLDELNSRVRTYGYTSISLGFAALVAIAVTSGEHSILRKVLAWRPLAMTGVYSYAVYVLHHPILLWLRNQGFNADVLPRVWGSQIPGLLVFVVVGTALAALGAFVSWWCIERPALSLKKYLPLGSRQPLPMASAPAQPRIAPAAVASPQPAAHQRSVIRRCRAAVLNALSQIRRMHHST